MRLLPVRQTFVPLIDDLPVSVTVEPVSPNNVLPVMNVLGPLIVTPAAAHTTLDPDNDALNTLDSVSA
jgi:hypothetical protein